MPSAQYQQNGSSCKKLHLTNLSTEEIEDPLLAIARIFDDNNLPAQLELLKEWRRCVLEDDYFKGERDSPSELLYFYRLTVSLVEAMQLLLTEDTQIFQAQSIQQLNDERNRWPYYPEGLTDAEKLNPGLIVESFFKAYTNTHYNQMLYDWLEHGLSSSAVGEFIETVDLIAFYENLQKLYGAAWIIYQRSADANKRGAVTTNTRPVDEKVQMLNVKLTEDQYRELQNTIDSLIKNHHPEQIILFGSLQYGTESVTCFSVAEHLIQSHYFLLMVMGQEQQPLHRLRRYITTAYDSVTVTVLAYGLKAIENRLVKNDLFFNTVLRDGLFLYRSGKTLQNRSFPEPDHLRNRFEAERHLENHVAMAMGFFAAARSAMEEDQETPGIAVCFLQQAAVQACLVLIKVFSGFKPATRGLTKLLELCFCFEPYLVIHFRRDTNEQERLYQLLANAYNNANHKDGVEVSIADAESLSEQVDEFVVMVQVCCARKIEGYNKIT
jgi:hypothetical protein